MKCRAAQRDDRGDRIYCSILSLTSGSQLTHWMCSEQFTATVGGNHEACHFCYTAVEAVPAAGNGH